MRAVTLVMLLLALVLPASALDVPLRFATYADRNTPLLREAAAEVIPTQQPPSGEWKLPSLKSETPAYVLVKLGGAEFLAILDVNSPGDSFYTRMYFDANRNRDLTDDSEVRVGAAYSWWAGVGAIRSAFALNVALPDNGKDVPYSFMLQARLNFSGFSPSLSQKENWDKLKVTVMPCCLLMGEFSFGGGRWSVTVSDRNGNGKFDDVASPAENKSQDGESPSPKGDWLYIRSGRWEVDDGNALGMCDKLFLNAMLFDVRIDRPANKMILTPAAQPTGTLALPQGMQRLVLSRSDGKSAIVLLNPGQAVPVPPGDYRVHSYCLIRQSKMKQLWQLKAEGSADGAVTRVVEGAQATLTVCEPLKPKVRISSYEKPGLLNWSGSASMDFVMRGAGGERITGLALFPYEARSNAWSITGEPPTYKIMTDDGQIVAQGQFEYG